MGQRRCCDLCDNLAPRDPSKTLPDTWGTLKFSRATHDPVNLELCDDCATFVQSSLIEVLAQLVDKREGISAA